MIDLSLDLYEKLKAKGFKRVPHMPFNWTRHRWWMFWHMPNGGDFLKVEPTIWAYFPTPGGKVQVRYGQSNKSLDRFLRSL